MAVAAATAAIAVGSAAMSFSQASKQRKAAERADLEAAEKMSEARARLEVNYADALAIQKEPYERQREALLSAGAQALQQGVESERGGAATAGRVLASQTEAQGQVRDQMNRDLFDLEAMKAEEESRLRDINVQLDLQEASGAQQAAAEARMKQAMANQQGVQRAINAAAIGVEQLDLGFKENVEVPNTGNTTTQPQSSAAQIDPMISLANRVNPRTNPISGNLFGINGYNRFGINRYNPFGITGQFNPMGGFSNNYNNLTGQSMPGLGINYSGSSNF